MFFVQGLYFKNILIQMKVGEKKVDASYLNDEVMFLLADSFSLGTVLFEINEALSITRYNQV